MRTCRGGEEAARGGAESGLGRRRREPEAEAGPPARGRFVQPSLCRPSGLSEPVLDS